MENTKSKSTTKKEVPKKEASNKRVIKKENSKKKSKSKIEDDAPLASSGGESSDSEYDYKEEKEEKEVETPEKEVEIPESYVLPVLYKNGKILKNGTQKIIFWKVWVIKNILYTTYGDTEGKSHPQSERSFQGLKTGKVDGEEQAKRVAEREWISKLNDGYMPKKTDEKGTKLAKKLIKAKNEQGGTDTNISSLIRGSKDSKDSKSKKSNTKKGIIVGYESDIFPMCCQLWNSKLSSGKTHFDFESGVFLQPKLDGIRCLGRVVKNKDGEGETLLLSRNGKQFVWLEHIREELKIFLSGTLKYKNKDILIENIVSDGEFYVEIFHATSVEKKSGKGFDYSFSNKELDVVHNFSAISSICKTIRSSPHELEEQIQYHIFDIADVNRPQNERFDILKKLFERGNIVKKCPHIKMVSTKEIHDPQDINDFHDEVLQQNYEGVIIRDKRLKYESGKRSAKIRKYKYFIEEEYPIVDCVKNEGVDNEHFCWVCEKKVGNKKIRFNAKPKDTKEVRLNLYKNRLNYIGKMLTVKFQQYTADGVPRFPIALRIRKPL